jgi:hypothetical protein
MEPRKVQIDNKRRPSGDKPETKLMELRVQAIQTAVVRARIALIAPYK